MFKIFSKPSTAQIAEARRIQSLADKEARKAYEERKAAEAKPGTPATKSATPVMDNMIDKLKKIVAKHEAKKNKADNNPAEDIEPVKPIEQKPTPPPYHSPPTPEDSNKLPMVYTDTSEPYDPFPKSNLYEVVDVLASKASTSPVWQVNDYFLSMIEGKVYFKSVNSKSAPVALKKTSAPISHYATLLESKLDDSEHLTEEDLGLILKAKPTAEQLLSRFAKYDGNGVDIDTSRAAQVW